jgi:hypothetical protein
MEIITEEILSLVKKKMEEQGGYTIEAYKQFIDETIDYFMEKGKLGDDDNLEFIESNLINRWNDIKDKIGA